MHEQSPRSALPRALTAPRRIRRPLALELLETRALLSAGPVTMVPFARVISAPPAPAPFTGYTPQQIKQAYSLTGVGDGTGQTIAIVDAYNDPTIAADLAAFDTNFGLGTANLTVVNQTGGSTLPSGSESAWSTETALDVEWAHAIAPGAKILLVEANTGSQSDLLAGVQTAANYAGVSVVSMSWGAGEFSGETAYDSYFTTPSGHTPVAFVASTGDSGAGSAWPASSPNVLAVGGTTLTLGTGNSYGDETAWSESGGGYSDYETASSAQHAITGSNARTTPDVSYDANPTTGFAVYSGGSWTVEGGTSAGTPQWAAIIAIADQTGGSALSSSQIQTAVYTARAQDFHDITQGSNGYPATVGYDLVTGMGTPVGNLLIPNLVSPGGGGGVTGGGSGGGGSGGGHTIPEPPAGSSSPYVIVRVPSGAAAFLGGRALSSVDTSGVAAAVNLGTFSSQQIPAVADQAFSLLAEGNLSLQSGSSVAVRQAVAPANAANPPASPDVAGEAVPLGAAPRTFDVAHSRIASPDDAAADLLSGDAITSEFALPDTSVPDGGDPA